METTTTTPTTNPDAPPGDHKEGADWRQRAVAAEQRVDQLSAKVSELEGTLSGAREALAAGERRHAIERALVEAEAIDVEAAALLAEAALGAMKEPDVRGAVRDLKRRKPFLFASRMRASAMSAATVETREGAAERARSGDRRALVDYLRLRRSA